MIEFNNWTSVPTDITGLYKVTTDESIRYFKNRMLHRKDGPAVIYPNGEKYWHLNGHLHREDGPAIEIGNGYKRWYYKGDFYGYDNQFSNKSWKKFVKELKREEKFGIFK